MFILCRNYLQHVAKDKAKIQSVDFRPQQSTRSKHCSIFTLPARNRLAFTLDHQSRRIWKWQDPGRLNDANEPVLMQRRIAADQSINFRVLLTDTTAEKVDTLFQDFIRGVSKTIYDGTKAVYLDTAGERVEDNKGNVIHVQVNNYDFNDNQWYGANTNKVVIDFQFNGAIYFPDEVMSSMIFPAAYVSPSVGDVDTE